MKDTWVRTWFFFSDKDPTQTKNLSKKEGFDVFQGGLKSKTGQHTKDNVSWILSLFLSHYMLITTFRPMLTSFSVSGS